MPLDIVILAAGQGTRMRSDRPKVLQPLAGRPLLAHVLATAAGFDAARLHVVYGHGGPEVRAAFPDDGISWVEQAEQLGTGHALMQAMPEVADDGVVLVLYGDVPLIRADTLAALVDAAGSDRLGLLTAEFADPTGYGRIVRDAAGAVQRIVEQKDATAEEATLCEINTGFVAAPARLLRGWLQKLSPENAQGEYYLTDIVALAARDGIEVQTVSTPSPHDVLGINDRRQLAEVEAVLRQRNAESLLDAGVTLSDPARIDVRGTLTCGRDVQIDVNCVFEGEVKLDDGVRVGPNCYIRDTQIEQGTTVLANCVIEQAHIGPRCDIGPFSRVRPETYLGSEVRIGNFVEVKKSAIARGSKVSHLTYIGDTTMGERVNIGAGTIVCNYDGAAKHRTRIGDDVFVGSGVELVAPVEIGDGATIGAGSTISKDAKPDMLTIARARQTEIPGWKRPRKAKK